MGVLRPAIIRLGGDPVPGVCKGLRLGLEGMRVGGKRSFVVPAGVCGVPFARATDGAAAAQREDTTAACHSSGRVLSRSVSVQGPPAHRPQLTARRLLACPPAELGFRRTVLAPYAVVPEGAALVYEVELIRLSARGPDELTKVCVCVEGCVWLSCLRAVVVCSDARPRCCCRALSAAGRAARRSSSAGARRLSPRSSYCERRLATLPEQDAQCDRAHLCRNACKGTRLSSTPSLCAAVCTLP